MGKLIREGRGHSYAGPKMMLKTGLFGLAMAGLYVLTGTIWLLIVLHVVMDLVYGAIGREVIAGREVRRVQNLSHR